MLTILILTIKTFKIVNQIQAKLLKEAILKRSQTKCRSCLSGGFEFDHLPRTCNRCNICGVIPKHCGDCNRDDVEAVRPERNFYFISTEVQAKRGFYVDNTFALNRCDAVALQISKVGKKDASGETQLAG